MSRLFVQGRVAGRILAGNNSARRRCRLDRDAKSQRSAAHSLIEALEFVGAAASARRAGRVPRKSNGGRYRSKLWRKPCACSAIGTGPGGCELGTRRSGIERRQFLQDRLRCQIGRHVLNFGQGQLFRFGRPLRGRKRARDLPPRSNAGATRPSSVFADDQCDPSRRRQQSARPADRRSGKYRNKTRARRSTRAMKRRAIARRPRARRLPIEDQAACPVEAAAFRAASSPARRK